MNKLHLTSSYVVCSVQNKNIIICHDLPELHKVPLRNLTLKYRIEL